MICKPNITIGPRIGSVQPASERICKALQNIGPVSHADGVTIIYGSSGAVSYGSSGVITY